MFQETVQMYGVINHYFQYLKMEIYFFKVEFLLIISHLRDNYGVLPPTIGLSTKVQHLDGGEKDLRDNLNLLTY